MKPKYPSHTDQQFNTKHKQHSRQSFNSLITEFESMPTCRDNFGSLIK